MKYMPYFLLTFHLYSLNTLLLMFWLEKIYNSYEEQIQTSFY